MGVSKAPQYTSLDNMVDAIQQILHEYRRAVLGGIEQGIDEGANLFIKEAQKVSPVDTGEYQSSWTVKPMNRAKYVRYVGNTKRVRGKNGPIPLINILEFSSTHGKPHVGTAVANSHDQIINLVISKIK